MLSGIKCWKFGMQLADIEWNLFLFMNTENYFQLNSIVRNLLLCPLQCYSYRYYTLHTEGYYKIHWIANELAIHLAFGYENKNERPNFNLANKRCSLSTQASFVFLAEHFFENWFNAKNSLADWVWN